MTSYAVFLALLSLDALGWLPMVRDGWWLLILALTAAGVTPLGMWILARRCGDGTPVLLSVLIAACVAASLLAGLVLAASSVSTLLGRRETVWAYWPVAFTGTLVGAWAVGTPLLWAYCRRRDPETALGRISSRLFLGTMVEAGAIIPLDVMVRRKTDCYCGEGTMWALTICWAAGTVVLGPFVWLIPMGRRRRRWYAGRCPVCEYDMRGCMDAERCPECGAGWRPVRPRA
jgi:hypothetical protein